MTTNPLEQKIEQMCLDIIEAKKWRPFRDIQVKVPEEPLPNPVMAYIDLQIRRINIFVDGNIEQLIQEVIQKEKLALDVPAYLEALMYFGVVHEYGHHRYCPRTNEYMKSILTGIYEAIQGREFKEERIEGLCLSIHNMFSDSILNAINSHTDDRKELFQSGFNLFYLTSGYNSKKMKQKGDKAMTLFLRSNQALSQTPPEINEKVLRYQHRRFMGLPRYTKKVLNVFTGDKELTRSLIIGNSSKEETDYLTGRLKETALWKQMSYDYAQIIYPFLRQPPAGLDNSFTRSNEPNSSGESNGKCEKCEGKQGEPNKNQSGGQGDGQSNNQSKKQAGKFQNHQDDQSGQGNQNDQSSQDNQSNNNNQDHSSHKKNPGKEKEEQSAGKEDNNDNNSNHQNQPGKKESGTDKNDDLNDNFRKGKEKEGKSTSKEQDNDSQLEYTPRKSNPMQENPKDNALIKLLKKMLIPKTEPFSSPYLNQFGLLDRLYTSRAGKIKLFAEEYREGAHHELPLSRSEMPLDEFSSRQVDWSSTRIITQNDGKKEVMLYRRDTPIILPFESEYSQGGLPDLSFILTEEIALIASIALTAVSGRIILFKSSISLRLNSRERVWAISFSKMINSMETLCGMPINSKLSFTAPCSSFFQGRIIFLTILV